MSTVLGDYTSRREVGVNDGAGRFTAVPPPAWDWQSAQDLELGDVTGDGLVDLLVLHEPVNERVEVTDLEVGPLSTGSPAGSAAGSLEDDRGDRRRDHQHQDEAADDGVHPGLALLPGLACGLFLRAEHARGQVVGLARRRG